VTDPAALAEKSALAEHLVGERFLSPEGLLVYRRRAGEPSGPPRPPYGNLADSACWGGYYLGAEALRYAATGDRAAAERLDRVLSGMELLEAVTGKPGLFARCADRGLSPETAAARGGRWRPAALPGWHYRGDVSKDQYAGVLFGLGCVLRFGGEAHRSRAGRLLTAIADHLGSGEVAIRNADGEVTTHGKLADRYLGIPVAVNAAVALAAFRLSAAAGNATHTQRYRELVDRGYARSASFAKVSVLGKTNRNNDHMATAGLYHLFSLENDPEVRELYRRGLARVARAARGEENAWFLGLFLACSGPDPDLLREARSALARMPLRRVSGPLDLRGKLDGVVPIELRAATAFQWRSDPYRLVKDPEGIRPRYEYAPVDLLVAYWLLRAHGLEEQPPHDQ
jgi:hypothetical protein